MSDPKAAKPHWTEVGTDPDYRFSLANERTFLAWIRTALGMLAGAILVHQFITKLQPQWLSLTLSLSLVAVSAILSVGSYLRWKGNEVAMRHARSLPRTFLLPFMTATATGIAVCVCVYLGMS